MKCPECKQGLGYTPYDVEEDESLSITWNCECGSNGTFYFSHDKETDRWWDAQDNEKGRVYEKT